MIIDDTWVEGTLSLTGRRNPNEGGFEISGLIQTEAYLSEAYEEICAGRLIIKDIKILSESFGSETNDIVYEFTAKSYIVLEGGDASD